MIRAATKVKCSWHHQELELQFHHSITLLPVVLEALLVVLRCSYTW
jgi:hypothetical protein